MARESADDDARLAPELDERFFDLSIDLLCFLDFNGYFKRLNPAWEAALGFTREELMSKPFIEFVHPDDRDRTLEQNRDVRGGGQALAFENRYLCKDGSYRWFLWNAAPDSDRRVIYSVARDITDRKRAEEERERLLVQLQAALAEVRTLQGILPMCSYCRSIRDDENYWQSVEAYISKHTERAVQPRHLPGLLHQRRGTAVEKGGRGIGSGDISCVPPHQVHIQAPPRRRLDQVGVLVNVDESFDQHQVGTRRDGIHAGAEQLAALTIDHPARRLTARRVVSRHDVRDMEAAELRQRRPVLARLEPVVHRVGRERTVQPGPAFLDDDERVRREVAARCFTQRHNHRVERCGFEPSTRRAT